jgi:hypothetical protein
MKFTQCQSPYPKFCKVWNNKEKEVYFTIIVDEHVNRYIDHNTGFWDNAVHLDELDLLNPVKTLEGNSTYDFLTVTPNEKDYR